MTAITYKDAGVDIEEGARAVEAIKEAVRTTYTPEVIGDIGGFGGLFSAASFKDMQEPVLVSGTDGVGTKIDLAKLLGKHSTIGVDLVAMCANDIVVCGAKPLFFLDYLAVGKLETPFAAEVVKGIAEGCRQAGCALIGGEMAEHPGMMQPNDYDLSGFCVGVVERSKMIGPDLVKENDVILGLASSGLHSNGYSLVRKVLVDAMGPKLLAKKRLPNGVRYDKALMAPTRIYVKELLRALEAGLQIHAAAHITGGGITKNLDRVLPKGLNAQVKLATWEVPLIIQEATNAAGFDIYEALSTFNMGIGMILICSKDDIEAITRYFIRQGRVYRIGKVIKAENPDDPGRVLYKTKPKIKLHQISYEDLISK